jgi:hypothetical protein
MPAKTDPSKITAQTNLTVEKGDMLDADSIAKVAKGSDVVVSSYAPPAGPQGPLPDQLHLLSEARPWSRESGGRACRASSWWAAPGPWRLHRGWRLSIRLDFRRRTRESRWRIATPSTCGRLAI